MGCVQKVTGEVICSDRIPKRNELPPKNSPHANPISEAIRQGKLKLTTCTDAEKELDCKDVYTYYSKNPIITCEQFKWKFNIPLDYPILNCPNNDAPLITTTIEAEKLRGFVYSNWDGKKQEKRNK